MKALEFQSILRDIQECLELCMRIYLQLQYLKCHSFNIFYFQTTGIPWPVLAIMTLAIINGLITSIILETIILIRQNFKFKDALKTALGMSFISMVSMEVAMNITDYLLTGGAMLTWWVMPIMLMVGFLTPWPYNYWRLKKFGIACH